MDGSFRILFILEELDSMQQQVRPVTASSDATRSGLAMFQGINADAVAKSLDALRQNQAAVRAQVLPKYKEKIQGLKELYERLQSRARNTN